MLVHLEGSLGRVTNNCLISCLEKLRYSDREKKCDIFVRVLIVGWNELVRCRQTCSLASLNSETRKTLNGFLRHLVLTGFARKVLTE
jgi:hypothetical protein